MAYRSCGQNDIPLILSISGIFLIKPDIFCLYIAKMPRNYKNSTHRQSWRKDNIKVEIFLKLLIIMKRNVYVYTLKNFVRNLDLEEDGKLMALGLQFLDIRS